MGTTADKLTYLNDTKTAIKDAIIAKGVDVADDVPFRNYADKIGDISGGEVVEKKKFGMTIDNLFGEVNSDGVYTPPASPFVVDLTGVVSGELNLAFLFKNNIGVKEFVWDGLKDFTTGMNVSESFSNCKNLIRIKMSDLENVYGKGTSNTSFWSAFAQSSGLTEIVWKIKKIVGGYTFYGAFRQCLSISDTALQNLEEIDGSYCCWYMFDGSGVSTTGLIKLKKISGSKACVYMFNNCRNLTKEYFYELVEVNAVDALDSMFSNCPNLTEIHFRADAQAVIEGLTGYDNKFGAKNAQIIFDL